MTAVTESLPDVSPNVIAGLLLAAKTLLVRLDLPYPSTAQILTATSAGRTRAYEYKTAILDQLAALTRPAGRPAGPAPAPPEIGSLSHRVLRFVMDNPGCVSHRSTKRQRYSDEFRCFVLGLWENEQANMELDTFARAVQIPLGTLKDWLRVARPQSAETATTGHRANGLDELAAAQPPSTSDELAATQPPSTSDEPAADNASSVNATHLETILAQWRTWRGDFSAFCSHLRRHLRLPYGRTLIASILAQLGERIPNRRPGRSPDEKALRGAFETFFPGAQWTGDGSPITVMLNGQQFTFNLELMVDTDSTAFVGASLRDEEDSTAVTTAFEDGVQTTGALPLGLLLDLRSCNHTDEVDQMLGDTLNIPATKSRPQNKAHVEGAFGLFQQTAPPLEVNANSPREQAQQILQLVVQTWGRTLNHKPRPRRQGLSRVEQYLAAAPTPEQVAQAKTALEQRLQKQNKARETNRARQDPVKRQILDQAFSRLKLLDPNGNLSAAIARYPLDDILTGIATFEGKQQANTLPDGVDARYLLGIVKNLAQKREGCLISEALLQARLQAQDLMLRGLQRDRDILLQTPLDPRECLQLLLKRALDTDRQIDRLFWLQTAADHLRTQPDDHRTMLWRAAYRRIHSTFRIPYADRAAAVQYLATKLVPLD
jgi:hypothetical protein